MLVSIHKVVLEHGHSYSFMYVYGCLHSTTARFKSYNRDYVANRVEIFTICSFTENAVDP